MTKLRGTYVGTRATVLESGKPVAPGDVVEIDDEQDPAVAALLTSVEEVSAKKKAKRDEVAQEATS